MVYCNREHPAIAFVGADCPACILRDGPGATLGSSSVSQLTQYLGVTSVNPGRRLSHDEYYLLMLRLVSARSTCARRAVGAIIVDEGHHVLSTGYNGVPRGFPHCRDAGGATDRPCPGANDPKGDTSRCLAIHAEQNALLQCEFNLTRAFKIYTSCAPCFACAKLIVNTSIRHVVTLEPYVGDAEGYNVLRRAEVTVSIAKV